MVIVSAEYAKYFNPAPQDGRTYIVQDPIRPWVDHVTRPDGTYVLLDKKKLSKSPPSAFVGEIEVHTKYQNSKHKKKAARLASKLTADTLVECQQDTPPLICLIDINRVMRICGFKKSFIYEQADFPTPVRLGVSQRSSVRWIESEIFAWVQNLANKREIPT